MYPSRWFILPDGRLRAGWRLFLFIVLFLVAMILFRGLTPSFVRNPAAASHTVLIAVSSLLGLAAVVLVTWIMMFLIEHQPFSRVGFIGRRAARETGLGFAGGAALIAIIAAAERSIGTIRFQLSGAGAGSVVIAVASGAGIIFISAATEELLFRGYPFQRLIEGTNDYVALAIASIVFGALHRANPYATNLSVANTILAGVLLSVGYLKTRALWFSISFHFSWNWALALCGLPISGLELGQMPWRVVPVSSRTWIYGGEYGPEGGVIATAVLAIATVWLLGMGEKESPPLHNRDRYAPLR